MPGLWSFVVALLALPIGAATSTAFAATVPAAANASSLMSLNWSGYVLSAPRGSIHGVEGSWIVQRVQPEPNNTYSSQWVGIDGFSGGGLIQTGTESDSIDHVPAYGAWAALASTGEVALPMTVRPGDVMAATVAKGEGNVWTIALTDVTRHEDFATEVRYSTSETSAEWVEERPALASSGSSSLSNLSYYRVAEFGSRYTGSLPDTADVGRAIGATVPTTLRSVQMLLTPGPASLVALTRVGPLESDGASFTVTRTKPFSSRGSATLSGTAARRLPVTSIVSAADLATS